MTRATMRLALLFTIHASARGAPLVHEASDRHLLPKNVTALTCPQPQQLPGGGMLVREQLYGWCGDDLYMTLDPPSPVLTCPKLELDESGSFSVKNLQFNIEQRDGGVGITTRYGTVGANGPYYEITVPFKIDFTLDVTEKFTWKKTISQMVTIADINLDISYLTIKAGPVLTMQVNASAELQLNVMTFGIMVICVNEDLTLCPSHISLDEPNYSALGTATLS